MLDFRHLSNTQLALVGAGVLGLSGGAVAQTQDTVADSVAAIQTTEIPNTKEKEGANPVSAPEQVETVGLPENFAEKLNEDFWVKQSLGSSTIGLDLLSQKRLAGLVGSTPTIDLTLVPSALNHPEVGAFRLYCMGQQTRANHEKGAYPPNITLEDVDKAIDEELDLIAQGATTPEILLSSDTQVVPVCTNLAKSVELSRDEKYMELFDACTHLMVRIDQEIREDEQERKLREQTTGKKENIPFPYHLRWYVDNELASIREHLGDEMYGHAKDILARPIHYQAGYQLYILIWAHNNPTFADLEELMVQTDEIRTSDKWGPKIYVKWFEQYIEHKAGAVAQEDRIKFYEGLTSENPPFQTIISPEVRALMKSHLDRLWGFGSSQEKNLSQTQPD